MGRHGGAGADPLVCDLRFGTLRRAALAETVLIGAHVQPSYWKVLVTFARNSLIRDMSYRTNFVFTCISSTAWALMNYGLFVVVYQHTDSIGRDTGWGQHEFFVFLGTIWLINSLVQTLFMQNMEHFSEMIRMGTLDFALLKPIDTQFLISFPRINWAQLPNGVLGVLLICSSIWTLRAEGKALDLSPATLLAFLFFVACGVTVMYSVMISLASTSVWLGRNQQLYNFWFYITNFYRYPMEIYQRGSLGWALWGTFTFVIPILVVSNVPARILAQPLGTPWQRSEWGLAAIAVISCVTMLLVSRWTFQWALRSYRSASS